MKETQYQSSREYEIIKQYNKWEWRNNASDLPLIIYDII